MEHTPEKQAAQNHRHSLKINFGGEKDAVVYFDIEQGELPNEWVVSEGCQIFFNNVEVTDLFEGYVVDQKIYLQQDAVDRQIEDNFASDMEEYYRPYDDDYVSYV